MGSTQPSSSTPAAWLRRLLAYLSQDWLSLVFDLYRVLRPLLPRPPQGMYEFLVYDATLELLDPSGQTAIFRKRQQVRFLQDHIIAFEDYAYGDGEIFAQYRVSPGVEADRYQESDRWTVLISLRETKKRGDVQEFYIERVVKHGFTQAEEWQQAEIRHTTRHLKLAVIFPKTRHCRRATIRLRRRNQVIPLGQEYFQPLPDGRQLLSWTTNNVRPLEVFTLRWQW